MTHDKLRGRLLLAFAGGLAVAAVSLPGTAFADPVVAPPAPPMPPGLPNDPQPAPPGAPSVADPEPPPPPPPGGLLPPPLPPDFVETEAQTYPGTYGGDPLELLELLPD